MQFPRLPRQPALRPRLGQLIIGCILLLPSMASAALPTMTYLVGPDRLNRKLSDVASKLQDGDTVKIAAGEYIDCAVISADNVTIVGEGPNGTTKLKDKSCQGKGILVVQGSHVTVRNLTLTGARVPSGNGAGIRAEGGDLIVDRVKFINNENGILGGPDGSTMMIRNSEFTENGGCDNPGGCSHGIYSGHLTLLRIENSKFFGTKQAHHIKSRSLRTEVIGCDISDGPKGTASYEIDIPNGGDVVVRNSTILKGPQAENHSGAIMIGAEGVTQISRQILIDNNVFKNTGDYDTVFVVNRTAAEADLRNNKLSGRVTPLKGDGTVQ